MSLSIKHATRFILLPFVAFVIFLVLTAPVIAGLGDNQPDEKDWQAPQELERVWQQSQVNFPDNTPGLSGKEFTVQNLPESLTAALAPKSLPTVVFLHGCAGLLPGEQRRIDFFTQHGYAVISPDSFARKNAPKSCRIFPKKAFMYRGTLPMRQRGLDYVLQQIKTIPWLDPKNLFLVGHSEGAILTATYQAKESGQINARIAESWTCQHRDWPEYRGIAINSEPILTLVSENDPWFQDDLLRGNCQPHLPKNNGSMAKTYPEKITKGKHKVMDFPTVQKDVLNFLNQHAR